MTAPRLSDEPTSYLIHLVDEYEPYGIDNRFKRYISGVTPRIAARVSVTHSSKRWGSSS
jgi:hypothetical protein